MTPRLLKVKQWFCPFRVQYIGRLGHKNALLHMITKVKKSQKLCPCSSYIGRFRAAFNNKNALLHMKTIGVIW